MNQSCICVILNNDHEYLKEWIDHHLNLGFNHIYLFEVPESKSHKTIINEYNENVSLFRIDQLDIDIKDYFYHQYTYNWFISKYKNEYEWCLFLDNIDSFFILTNELLENFLNGYHEKNALLIRWKLFNANGNTSKPYKGTVIENYDKQFYEEFNINDGHIYNSFVHMSLIENEVLFNSKFINYVNGLYDIDLNKDINNENDIKKVKVLINNAYINTYVTKSWVDWCSKIYKYINCKEKLIKNEYMSLDTFFTYNDDLTIYDEVFINNELKYFHNEIIKDNIYYILSYKYNKTLNDYNQFSQSLQYRFYKFYNEDLRKKLLNKKVAIVLLSNDINTLSYDRYSNLEFSLYDSDYDLYWAISSENKEELINGINYYIFDKTKLKEKYGKIFYAKYYNKLFNVSLVIQDFYENNPQYDYIWCVEDDVLFSGQWINFFEYFDNSSDADLLASNIQKIDYSVIHFISPLVSDSNIYNNNLFKEKLQSFNPVFRISSNALKILIDYYKSGNSGYYEFLMPSLINLHGLTLEDFGGDGEYVKPVNKNKWYIKTLQNHGIYGSIQISEKILVNLLEKLHENNKNILIHPVKILLNK